MNKVTPTLSLSKEELVKFRDFVAQKLAEGLTIDLEDNLVEEFKKLREHMEDETKKIEQQLKFEQDDFVAAI